MEIQMAYHCIKAFKILEYSTGNNIISNEHFEFKVLFHVFMETA